MRNYNALDQARHYKPYAPEQGLDADFSPKDSSKGDLRLIGRIATGLTLSDPHHVELHGIDDAIQLSTLGGSQKLTNAIHMIGRHQTDKVDARIAQIRRSQLRISTQG